MNLLTAMGETGASQVVIVVLLAAPLREEMVVIKTRIIVVDHITVMVEREAGYSPGERSQLYSRLLRDWRHRRDRK